MRRARCPAGSEVTVSPIETEDSDSAVPDIIERLIRLTPLGQARRRGVDRFLDRLVHLRDPRPRTEGHQSALTARKGLPGE